MAETIARIKVRQGNLADLPILQPGEQGYATDANRLFIGNNVLNIGLGDASQTEFGTPVDLDIIPSYEIRINDIVTVDYSVVQDGKLVVFNTAPALNDVITLGYNTELLTYQPDTETDAPRSVSIIAPYTSISQIAIDQNRYNNGEVKYTLRDTAGNTRTGTITFALNNSTHIMDDAYVTSSELNLPHEFDGTWNSDIFTLNVITTTTDDAVLTFITNFWKA